MDDFTYRGKIQSEGQSDLYDPEKDHGISKWVL